MHGHVKPNGSYHWMSWWLYFFWWNDIDGTQLMKCYWWSVVRFSYDAYSIAFDYDVCLFAFNDVYSIDFGYDIYSFTFNYVKCLLDSVMIFIQLILVMMLYAWWNTIDEVLLMEYSYGIYSIAFDYDAYSIGFSDRVILMEWYWWNTVMMCYWWNTVMLFIQLVSLMEWYWWSDIDGFSYDVFNWFWLWYKMWYWITIAICHRIRRLV